ETLTKQFEMAKVEEAKDLPTVRVLDEADVPEHKSRPHRSIIVLLGAGLAFLLACAYILGENWWSGTESDSTLKCFAGQVRAVVAADLSGVPGLRRIGSAFAKHGAAASGSRENE